MPRWFFQRKQNRYWDKSFKRKSMQRWIFRERINFDMNSQKKRIDLDMIFSGKREDWYRDEFFKTESISRWFFSEKENRSRGEFFKKWESTWKRIFQKRNHLEMILLKKREWILRWIFVRENFSSSILRINPTMCTVINVRKQLKMNIFRICCLNGCYLRSWRQNIHLTIRLDRIDLLVEYT